MLVRPSWVRRSRRAPALLTALALVAVITTSCESGNTENNLNGNLPDATRSKSSPPPFSTSEPERYQATRVITSAAATDPARPGADSARGAVTSQVLITRDRDKRREDFKLDSGETVSYLHLPAGTFLIYHSKKKYAEVTPDAEGEELPESVSSDFSPDKLLNESRTQSRYEKLGPEEVGGRQTTKYRVTVTSGGGAGQDETITTESLVWVDESLGMPIKSETTSAGGSSRGARYTTELRGITREVDAKLFELPPGYERIRVKDPRKAKNR